jgi:hypothetical protein
MKKVTIVLMLLQLLGCAKQPTTIYTVSEEPIKPKFSIWDSNTWNYTYVARAAIAMLVITEIIIKIKDQSAKVEELEAQKNCAEVINDRSSHTIQTQQKQINEQSRDMQNLETELKDQDRIIEQNRQVIQRQGKTIDELTRNKETLQEQIGERIQQIEALKIRPVMRICVGDECTINQDIHVEMSTQIGTGQLKPQLSEPNRIEAISSELKNLVISSSSAAYESTPAALAIEQQHPLEIQPARRPELQIQQQQATDILPTPVVKAEPVHLDLSEPAVSEICTEPHLVQFFWTSYYIPSSRELDNLQRAEMQVDIDKIVETTLSQIRTNQESRALTKQAIRGRPIDEELVREAVQEVIVINPRLVLDERLRVKPKSNTEPAFLEASEVRERRIQLLNEEVVILTAKLENTNDDTIEETTYWMSLVKTLAQLNICVRAAQFRFTKRKQEERLNLNRTYSKPITIHRRVSKPAEEERLNLNRTYNKPITMHRRASKPVSVEDFSDDGVLPV